MVYVGNLEYAFGKMLMSHMVADTLDELHEMASKIGIRRKWFQNDLVHPHYDICKSKKALAISYGAKVVTDQWIVEKFQYAKKLGLK